MNARTLLDRARTWVHPSCVAIARIAAALRTRLQRLPSRAARLLHRNSIPSSLPAPPASPAPNPVHAPRALTTTFRSFALIAVLLAYGLALIAWRSHYARELQSALDSLASTEPAAAARIRDILDRKRLHPVAFKLTVDVTDIEAARRIFNGELTRQPADSAEATDPVVPPAAWPPSPAVSNSAPAEVSATDTAPSPNTPEAHRLPDSQWMWVFGLAQLLIYLTAATVGSDAALRLRHARRIVQQHRAQPNQLPDPALAPGLGAVIHHAIDEVRTRQLTPPVAADFVEAAAARWARLELGRAETWLTAGASITVLLGFFDSVRGIYLALGTFGTDQSDLLALVALISTTFTSTLTAIPTSLALFIASIAVRNLLAQATLACRQTARHLGHQAAPSPAPVPVQTTASGFATGFPSPETLALWAALVPRDSQPPSHSPQNGRSHLPNSRVLHPDDTASAVLIPNAWELVRSIPESPRSALFHLRPIPTPASHLSPESHLPCLPPGTRVLLIPQPPHASAPLTSAVQATVIACTGSDLLRCLVLRVAPAAAVHHPSLTRAWWIHPDGRLA